MTSIYNPDDHTFNFTRKDVSDETIADLYSMCCEVTMLGLDKMFESEGKLGGIGKSIQIDEMKYGHWKYYRGRFVDGIWLFGCIDEETKQLRLEIIPDNKRNEENMLQLIEKHHNNLGEKNIW